MFFPFPATLDSVLYICGKLFYIEAMATYKWQRTADSFAPCPSAISTTTSFSSSKFPGDYGKNSDDSHALNPRKIYSSLN